MHVDEYIDSLDGDPYAQFVLSLFRLPAVKAIRWAKDIERSPLFCTWKGKRYRVTGASQLGDVWLHSDFSATVGYECRVDVEECSEWGADATPRPDSGGEKAATEARKAGAK